MHQTFIRDEPCTRLSKHPREPLLSIPTKSSALWHKSAFSSSPRNIPLDCCLLCCYSCLFFCISSFVSLPVSDGTSSANVTYSVDLTQDVLKKAAKRVFSSNSVFFLFDTNTRSVFGPFYAPKEGLKTAKSKSCTTRRPHNDRQWKITSSSTRLFTHRQLKVFGGRGTSTTCSMHAFTLRQPLHLDGLFLKLRYICNLLEGPLLQSFKREHSFINRGLVTSTVCYCTRSCGTNLITSMWSQPAQRQRNIHSLRRDSVLMW